MSKYIDHIKWSMTKKLAIDFHIYTEVTFEASLKFVKGRILFILNFFFVCVGPSIF